MPATIPPRTPESVEKEIMKFEISVGLPLHTLSQCYTSAKTKTNQHLSFWKIYCPLQVQKHLQKLPSK